jgi:cytochrome c biogenesis protein CcmG, thiol:disulfide interchange protein DsbE
MLRKIAQNGAKIQAMRIPRATFGLVVAGLGLILLGGAGALYAASRQADEALQPTDFSAIPASVRYPAPALELADLNGVQHRLADYNGQVVLVNLWATWCPPCQAEMPLLQQFFERRGDAGFTIVAVEDGEPASDVRAFVKQYHLTFPVWLDPTHQATDRAFKAMNLPTSYVLDRSGVVRLTWLGAISGANLEKYVTPIIEEK